MKNRSFYRQWPLFFVLLLFTGDQPASAAEVPLRSRAIDVLMLKSGVRLLGVLSSESHDHSTTILVRSEWLAEHQPEMHEELLTQFRNEVKAGDSREAVDALNAELEQLTVNGGSIEHVGHLRQQVEQLKEVPSELPALVTLEVPNAMVRRRYAKSPRLQILAGTGIVSGVSDVELLGVAELRAALEEMPPSAVRTRLPDPSATTLAVVDRVRLNADRIFGKVTRIVCHQDRCFSETAGEAGIEGIAASLLTDGLKGQLQQLLSGNAAPKAVPDVSTQSPQPGTILAAGATEIAVREMADIVEVKSMTLDMKCGAAIAKVDIYRQSDPSQWEFVTRATGRATLAEIKDDRKQSILNDPQVKQISSFASGLGRSREFEQAVSMGACVELALEKAQRHLRDTLLLPSELPVQVWAAKLTSLPE